MDLPTATYRLQLRKGMDFARARDLVPYLQDLGISHLYLSPVFTAAPGSTHGYDVTDPNEVEPHLGGLDGLRALSEGLRDHGMGLILDIVPNHMAFTVHNPWLHDVLRRGGNSPYHGHFDIDWAAGPLRLPWLGAPFADLVEAGDVEVRDGAMRIGDLAVPLGPVPDGDLHAIHAAQCWRLTSWRTEAAAITHRRFFTVTGLIGLRVEDGRVFDDVHRLTLKLVREGVVQGLRVDHVDGLADPAAYLVRLRAEVPDTPVWVEKILTREETLQDWPVQGTTGYVAARAIARALTDARGAARLAEDAPDFHATLMEAKDQIVTTELPAELERLTDLALAAGRRDARASEWGRAAMRDAIRLYIRAFPRYRTYATADTVSSDDRELIAATAERAAAALPHPGALPDLARLLTAPDGATLRLRMQQVTGAAIAKAQEDTSFYRHVALLSANEVGAEPDEPAMEVPAFHDAMRRRQDLMPDALTLTSSHDTKRSEDARMRIAALSHDPGLRDVLMSLTDLPPPWGWYLVQSAFAAAPQGDLDERLPAHLEKAVREAKQDTFWTAPNAAFEDRIGAAARAVAERRLPEALAPLIARAERLSLAQCALKLTIPGIPDIYQGTEVGSFLLTDPDNRRPVDFARLADALDGDADLSPFDRAKLSLTRTVLRLRRDRPELCRARYDPLDAAEGVLAFRRGALAVRVTVTGADLEADAGALWPPRDFGPQPVRLTLDAG
ncbi:malto-oligosyltrehalose synthase [Jannaschia sp. S6380]|uniref:malto-oligosyltrehalose synthase n=1 Tax=Jannaschia sp. S6380 TaxID=2926408 RepID=UPI001FF6B3C2|nr:malto-oligosyltrehalose synthase [Jannaschia sp. S6380]MCK0168462.1 malto-oligosyltrehalose synthase [Jannaschia sp. S6380]